jgi:hypothetical protein
MDKLSSTTLVRVTDAHFAFLLGDTTAPDGLVAPLGELIRPNCCGCCAAWWRACTGLDATGIG